MAAPNLDAILRAESGRIEETIYYDGLHTSLWLDLPETEEWQEEMGFSHSSLVYGRSLPENPLTWSDITPSNGSAGGSCLPPNQVLAFNHALRTFNMQHTSLNSPYFCLNDLRNAFRATEQLDTIVEILSENTRQAWIDRNRDQYVARCEHKLIAQNSNSEPFLEDDEWLAQEATGVLTAGMLERVYARLIRLGGARNSYGNVDGRPTFLGIGGMEITERLIQSDPNRTSLRYSDRVPELLAPLGAERLFKGFWLLDDVLPPRWNFEGGEWVPVPAQIWEDGELIDNSDYDTADAEDFIIYHPEVYRSVVMRTGHNIGAAKFNPLKYRGEWNWKNIEHPVDNPDGNMGFFRGVFANGSKSVFPKFGFTIRFLRTSSSPVNASSDRYES